MAALELDGWVMAALALALFWIHVLLIAGAALVDLRGLGRLHRRVRECFVAEVRSARGPDGMLARHWIEQLGRLDRRGTSGSPAQIHFHDRSHHSEVFGGTLALAEGRELELGASAGGQAEVWPELDSLAARAGQSEPEAFRSAVLAAGKAKGFARRVETPIAVGDRLWVVGLVGEASESTSSRAGEPPLILALADPRAWLLRARALVVGFVIADLALAGLCTALALWPPHFEWISMLGAAGALGWFLVIQPLGVSVHDAVRTPGRAFLRGSWRERG